MSEDRYSTGSVVLAFVVGGLVGAGIALLTAPQSGRETREKIKDLTEDAKDKIKTLTAEAKDKIQQTYEQGKDAVADKKNVIASAIEAGKKAMEEEKVRLAEGK
ncbi:MAG: YtxH domain-containing protein [Nitrospirae bacterium]|nr:YtxH domain-containing protein [Nitrospirota bacterium]MBI5694604.1 YtxH domain-containing protein [Nitrospirota bacterium]